MPVRKHKTSTRRRKTAVKKGRGLLGDIGRQLAGEVIKQAVPALTQLALKKLGGKLKRKTGRRRRAGNVRPVGRN